GRDHADAFAARPMGEVLEVEIAAGRPRIFGMDVQVGLVPHAMCVGGCRRPPRAPSESLNVTLPLFDGAANAGLWTAGAMAADAPPAQIFRTYAAPHKCWARCGKKGHDGASPVVSRGSTLVH